MCSLSGGKTVSEERPDPERQKGQTRTQVLWLKTCWFRGLLNPMFLGTVISGKVKWGRITEEVLWGRDTQLFQTDSHQLFFLRGGKEGMACTNTSSGMHNKRWAYGRVAGTTWQWGCFFTASTRLGSCLLLNYCAGASWEMCSPDDSW